MKIVIDTSLWVPLLRDRSGVVKSAIDAAAGNAALAMVPVIRLELLQGCRGPAEWARMLERLDAFETLPLTSRTWDEAARIYFDLRQAGATVRSTLDCCLAQCCIEHSVQLLHNDRDFEVMGAIRPSLKHLRLDLQP